jgi:hypothetical protein
MIDLDPVFNDLSCKPLAADKYEASKRMEEFAGILNEFPSKGMGRSLRTPGDFYGLEIAPSYTVSDWMYDAESPQVERELFLVLATKSPVLAGLDPSICDKAGSSEAICSHGVSEAMLVCYLINFPLISLGHDLWESSSIDCEISEMDDEGEISKTDHCLVNFSASEHFESHSTWIESRKAKNLHSPKDIWQKKELLFPHLCFAESVEAQLDKIPGGSDLSAQVIDRLFDLERVASLGKPFDNSAFRTTCSASSGVTLDKFGASYTFKDDSGTAHVCGWHLKMQHGNRIYFAHLGDRYLIGHIGEHLPTKKFN